jgi:hypothetical protein
MALNSLPFPPITKVFYTFNERAKKITEKIFINNKDLDFIKGDYYFAVPCGEKLP